jgi:transcriptional regulator with XRE-family HTH domain
VEAPSAQDGATTGTITAVIAERVKQLRVKARLSGPALAAAMAERGIPWNRTTVAKLENGHRESISVRELLALAVVLDVPPVWLLADPTVATPVSIAEGIEASPWTALMWFTGFRPLDELGEASAWAIASNALHQLNALARLLEQYRLIRRMTDAPMVGPQPVEGIVVAESGVLTIQGDPAEARQQLEATEVTLLRSIADRLDQFRALELAIPPVPMDVRKRAEELGIKLLPDQEDGA